MLAPAQRFLPSGTVWTRDQLEALPGLCLHDLMLLSIDKLRLFFGRQVVEQVHGADTSRSATSGDQQALAMLHEEMGDCELALANVEKALDVNPLNSVALKLMMKWHHPHPSTAQEVIGKVDFYLLNSDFDEEMQISYVQMLQDNGNAARAGFELEKMQLFSPANTRIQQLKLLSLEKHLQDTSLS